MNKIRFVEHRQKAFILSLVVILAGIISLFIRGLNLGIDFTGGTRLHINIGEEYEISEVRELLTPLGLEGSQAQKAGDTAEGTGREVIIKTPPLAEEERNEVIAAFQEKWPQITADSILAVENVGPTVGRELRNQAFWALLLAMVGIIIYITLRFEFKLALAAIIALVHDALFVLAFFSIFQVEINSPFVAAILTIVGYSINDTIVVFDRIRENLKAQKKDDLKAIVNLSLNQSLVRCINTSVTTLLVIIPILIMGGVALRPFIVALFIGLVAGTFSSLFIASELWYNWKTYRRDDKTAQTT
ncbi:MAG TPA: protein translocase subunit SecF [Firmicutes bacterium]|nr:protein translocase subunit SecF [Bacillota bacterium]